MESSWWHQTSFNTFDYQTSKTTASPGPSHAVLAANWCSPSGHFHRNRSVRSKNVSKPRICFKESMTYKVPDPGIVFKALPDPLGSLGFPIIATSSHQVMISKTKPMAFSSEVAVARLSNVLASRHLLTKNWRKKNKMCQLPTQKVLFTPYTHRRKKKRLDGY